MTLSFAMMDATILQPDPRHSEKWIYGLAVTSTPRLVLVGAASS
jgi:hypothetical protein